MNSKGYVGTTLRGIASTVGMEAQSLYNYFDSKQDLFAKMVEDGTRHIQNRVEGAILQAGQTPSEKLWAGMKAHVMFYCDFEEVVLTREMLPHVDEKLRSKIIGVLKNYENMFKQILSDGVSTGEFREMDISTTSFALLGLGESVVNWFTPGGRLSAEEVGEQYANLAMRIVKPD